MAEQALPFSLHNDGTDTSVFLKLKNQFAIITTAAFTLFRYFLLVHLHTRINSCFDC